MKLVISLTPRLSGVFARPRTSRTASAVSRWHETPREKTAKAVNRSIRHPGTPLKRGVNEILPSVLGPAAFTLTDLLVILAVVSLLSAIVVAQATALRSKSGLARCTANLQQIDRAVLSFCNDNNQTLPTVTPGDQKSLWWWYKEQVKKYVGLTGASSPSDTVFACPQDRGYSDPKPFCQSQRFDYGSYVFNGVTMEGVPNIAGWQLSAVKHPRRTLLVMEWTAHAPLSWHKSKTGQQNMPFYCGAQSVVGFVDGHVGLTKIYYDGYNAAYTQDPIEGYDYQYSGD